MILHINIDLHTWAAHVQVPELDRCTDNKAKIEYHIYVLEDMMEIQVEETKVANINEMHSISI